MIFFSIVCFMCYGIRPIFITFSRHIFAIKRILHLCFALFVISFAWNEITSGSPVPNTTNSYEQCNNDTISNTYNEDNYLKQALWHSIGETVITDLSYLKSLATSSECKQNIEADYLKHILYPIIRKNKPFSYGLRNLCPHSNIIQSAKKQNKYIQNLYNHNTLRIVYLIIMHKNPKQVIRLISALNTSMDFFLIHIDKKSSKDIVNSIANFSISHNNIHLMEQHELVWGGFKMVEIELNAMEYAVNNLSFRFDFFYPLSESDYPLVSTVKIRKFLNKYRGKTLLKTIQKLSNDKMYTTVHTECDNKLFYVGKRPSMERNTNIKIYSSTTWASFDYEFVKYLVNNNDIVPEYMSFFEGTATVDEKLFATILINSPLCNNYININWYLWRIELWPEKNTDNKLFPCRLRENTNIPFCGRGPIQIKYEHLPILQATSAMFARKFNVEINENGNNILDVIDEWRNNDKPEMIMDHKLIKISSSDGYECLSYFDERINNGKISNLMLDECDNEDETQLFMLSDCTEQIYYENGECLMSKQQYNNNNTLSRCQIKGIEWNDRYKEYEANNECISLLKNIPKITKTGMSITMQKCKKDGYSQYFYFEDCMIKYGNPILKYLKKENQNLCISFCDNIDYNRPCIETCNQNNNDLPIIHLLLQ